MSKNKDGADRKERKDTRKSDFFSNHEHESSEVGSTFGSRLQEARIGKGYTQESFANEIGMSFNTYKKYEQGSYQTDRPFFINYLAQKLNVSSDYLVGLSDNKHPDYAEVIQKTGLSSDSIAMLCHINNIDEEDICKECIDDEYVGETTTKHNGYMDFINCFLGNAECTELFIEGLLPMIRELSNCIDGSDNHIASTSMEKRITFDLTNYICDYIRKVVVPSFQSQYSNGSFTPVDPLKYCSDVSAIKKNSKRKSP